MNGFVKKKLLYFYVESYVLLIERKRFLLEFDSI